MRTQIINDTYQTFQLKEGNAGAFRLLRVLNAKGEDGCTFSIKVDPNATYREYMVATGKKGKSIIITSDDFSEYEVIKIVEVAPSRPGTSVTYKSERSNPRNLLGSSAECESKAQIEKEPSYSSSAGIQSSPPAASSSAGVQSSPPAASSSAGVQSSPPAASSSAGVQLSPPVGSSSAGVRSSPLAGSSSAGVQSSPLAGSSSAGVRSSPPAASSIAGVQSRPPAAGSSSAGVRSSQNEHAPWYKKLLKQFK